MIENLSQIFDGLPLWAKLSIGIFLVVYSILSVWERINLKHGAKMFSRVPPSKVRSAWGHIIQYTIIPIAVTVWYCRLLIVYFQR